jgi:uncharacterized protein YjiS (DUF1127 family)
MFLQRSKTPSYPLCWFWESGGQPELKETEMIQLLAQIGLLGRRWATYIRVLKELETYSERELNDMGMSRSDIGRVAMEAASLVDAPAKQAATDEKRPALLRQRFSPYL